MNFPTTISLCTFPDDDCNYCHSFVVDTRWLIQVLERMDELNERRGVSIRNFMDNYVWDETWAIYNIAKAENRILFEEEIP